MKHELNVLHQLEELDTAAQEELQRVHDRACQYFREGGMKERKLMKKISRMEEYLGQLREVQERDGDSGEKS